MKKLVKIFLVIVIIVLVGYLFYLGFSLKNVGDKVTGVKDESNQRTLENYASTIEYQYMVSYMSGEVITDVSTLSKNYIGDKIVCENSSISNGKVTLNNCTVGNDKTLYNYINGKTKKS